VSWRLPSVVELKSVQDPSLPAPFVPASVFTGVQSEYYWSASSSADNPGGAAWLVGFFSGGVVDSTNKALNANYTWCVRGPMQESLY